jgi:hypothetical protein
MEARLFLWPQLPARPACSNVFQHKRSGPKVQIQPLHFAEYVKTAPINILVDFRSLDKPLPRRTLQQPVKNSLSLVSREFRPPIPNQSVHLNSGIRQK